MTWNTELDLAVVAARKAGGALRDLIGGEKPILSQTDKDIKLQADRDAEAIILEALAASEYPVLAEESGEVGITDAETPFWVVDPLDGTQNFSRGLPICCVSIALCRKDESLLGVLYDFNHDECFQAVQGQAAQCNGETIRVSDVTQKRAAMLAVGFSSYRDYSSESLGQYIEQAQQFKVIRSIGSAALSLAYVACGRLDAYFEEEIMLWDVAAGIAIVEAAGGAVELSKSSRYKWGRTIRSASSRMLLAQ